MSATGLEVFDKTVQETNIWLNEIAGALGADRHLAWHVLGAVLRVTRDRLPLALAIHLGAQLPLLVRGAYYDQWRPPSDRHHSRSQEDFVADVAANLAQTKPVNRVDAIRAVFDVLERHITHGQMENVRDALPKSIRGLWPETPAHAS
ncbi:MAG: DUF2267 domain-containing protein [Magnetospirillum sp.]|nr:DUF2267 domain-containing protein [Magnetospirillum sp.]